MAGEISGHYCCFVNYMPDHYLQEFIVKEKLGITPTAAVDTAAPLPTTSSRIPVVSRPVYKPAASMASTGNLAHPSTVSVTAASTFPVCVYFTIWML
jgi:hypothetical protein